MPIALSIYHSRRPTDSPLWKILHNHYEDFKAGQDEHCERQYGFGGPLVDEAVEECLKRGDLHASFARVRCTNPGCRLHIFWRSHTGVSGFVRVAL
jgi:hypothetical protein